MRQSLLPVTDNNTIYQSWKSVLLYPSIWTKVPACTSTGRRRKVYGNF